MENYAKFLLLPVFEVVLDFSATVPLCIGDVRVFELTLALRELAICGTKVAGKKFPEGSSATSL